MGNGNVFLMRLCSSKEVVSRSRQAVARALLGLLALAMAYEDAAKLFESLEGSIEPKELGEPGYHQGASQRWFSPQDSGADMEASLGEAAPAKQVSGLENVSFLKIGIVVSMRAGSRYCTHGTITCNSTQPAPYRLVDASGGY